MFNMLKMGWFFTLLPRTLGYLADKRVPFYYKVIPFLVVPFFFTPLDRITNIYPIWGLLDNFMIVLLSAWLFTWLAAGHIRSKYSNGNGEGETVANTIEGEYTVVSQETERV